MDNADKKLVKEWFNIKNISRDAQKSYKLALKCFVDVIKKKPTKLIEEAKEEENCIVPRKRTVYKYLLKFKNYLYGCELAPSTGRLYFYAVCSFYTAFDLSIVNNFKVFPGEVRLKKNVDNYITREEICQLIDIAPPRESAIIYLAALSGISKREVQKLTIKQLLIAGSEVGYHMEDVYDLFQYEEEILSEVLTIDLTKSANSVKHHLFIPPEVSREIIAYLKERCYGKNDKIRIKGRDDKIFVNRYGNKLSTDSIITNLRNLGEKAGFIKEKNTYCFWRYQSLRKYFVSLIINKKGGQIVAYYMAGLRISNNDRSYWIAHHEELKRHYIEFLPFLSLAQ